MAYEHLPPDKRIRLLVQTFPCLKNALGIRPWDAVVFDQWATSGTLSHGELLTAQFILWVWDTGRDWKCGRFNIADSLRTWDLQHRQAFFDWANEAWWA